MSERTLRRKLQDEHTSFQKLLGELRMHVAIKYLRDTDLTPDEIADALGFSDAANFRRAFVRWTKETPHRFREGFARAAPRAGASRDLPHRRADPRRR
jgi:AraC-like DNA-binding protein